MTINKYRVYIYDMSNQLPEFKTGLYGMRKAWLSMSPGETIEQWTALEEIERLLDDLDSIYEQLKDAYRNANSS